MRPELRRLLQKAKARAAFDLKSVFQRDRFGVSLWDITKLECTPRYKRAITPLLGKHIEVTDAYWYLYCYREIWLNEIYRFVSVKPDPLVIDCGANIGLSVLYFKWLYPQARITAFEPDSGVFAVLQRNLRAYGILDCTLYAKAVWKCDGELAFLPDGSVGGRLIDGIPGTSSERTSSVSATRLKPFLTSHVDFLKVDIEGAEMEVLQDCEQELANVDHLFVEYHGASSADQTLDQVLALLRRAGFRYHIREADPLKHPFVGEERDARYFDLVLNVFAYRNPR